MTDKLNNLEEDLKFMGITPAELARRSEVSAPTITRIINNPNYNPGIETVEKIKKCLSKKQVDVGQTIALRTLNDQIENLKADNKWLREKLDQCQTQLDELIKKL